MEKSETIIKQEKIIEMLNNLKDWKLELMSEENPNMERLSKEDHQILMECVWITLGKEEGTKKEIQKGIGEIIVLCTLENFRRKGLMFINKKGNYDKTPIGREVYKQMLKDKGVKKE